MNTISTQDTKPLKNLATVVYALQVAGLFLGGLPAIIGLIINYIKKPDAAGTWIESHFRWQMRTFWFALLWLIVGMLSLFIYAGILVLIADFIWVIYRIVKGWLALNDNKSLYNQA